MLSRHGLKKEHGPQCHNAAFKRIHKMVLPDNLNDAQRNAIITCLRIFAALGADEPEEEENRAERTTVECDSHDDSAEKTGGIS